MEINENVYGARSSWIESSYNLEVSSQYRSKKANFGNNNSKLSDGVTANKLSYSSPIDKTLSYCGLGTESALSHIRYIYRKDDATPLELDIRDSQDRFVTNFAFFEKTDNFTDERHDGVINTDYLSSYLWQENPASTNMSPHLEPWTLVNPKSIVLYVYVKASTGMSNDVVTFSLNDYIANRTSSHKYIQGVFIVPYFGDPTGAIYRTVRGGHSPSTGYMTPKIALIDNYTIPSKSIDKPCYYYSSADFCILGSPINGYYVGTTQQSQLVTNTHVATVFVTENAESHMIYGVDTSVSYNIITYFRIEYYSDFLEDVLKTVSCFGLYFTGDSTTAVSGELTDTNMYIGLIDEDGIGHGRYLQGANTANAPQAAATFTDMHTIQYDPNREDYDKTKYKNGTNFNLWDFSLNCINKFYVLTEAQVEQLSTELYTIMQNISADTPIDRHNQVVFLTQNPIDCIVSIKRFPVDVPHLGTDTTVKLGSESTNITTAHYLLRPCGAYYFTFSNASLTGLYPTFGNSFLDYEPYTKVSINVPFCGTFDVPCNYFHRYGGVSIALLIDFVTGACSALLMVNGNVVDSLSGECGVNVPLSGLQTATIDSQIFNASMSKQKQDNNFALSMLGGAAAIGIGIATGGAATVVGGAAAMVAGVLNEVAASDQLDYQLNHMQAPIKEVSSASGVIARANDMRCKMIISRPRFAEEYNAEYYASTIGFACLLNGVVADFSGFTIGSINVDNIAATAEEKELIKNAFAKGVYL